jgi:hypothetical protein
MRAVLSETGDIVSFEAARLRPAICGSSCTILPSRPIGVLFCVALCMFATCVAAHAQTIRTIGPFTISFYNTADKGDEVGKSDQNWTAAEMADVTSCIATWTSRITNTTGRQIQLHFLWNNLGGNLLGQTYNPTVGDNTTSWTDVERIWRVGDNRSFSQSYDARIALSTGINWNIGSQNPGSSQYDLRTIITHEIGHTLGFCSTYDSSTDTFGSVGLSTWDTLLRDSASGGNRPAINSTGSPGNFNQTANPVYFVGTAAEAANGSNAVPVYAPNTFQSGSSLSHLDQSSFPNALMRPQFGWGVATRAPMNLEWAIMQDLGWSLATVKTWTKGAGTLSWTSTANWSPNGPPDSSCNVNFSGNLTAGDTLILGGNQTINALTIDSTVSFTIGGGAGTLTLGSGYITRTAASSGTQTIARPVSIGSNGANTVWDISGAGSMTLTGSLTASSITKVGTGMVVLAGTASVPGTFDIDSGTLALSSTVTDTFGSVTGAGALIVGDGAHRASLTVNSVNIGTLTLGAGSTLTIKAISGGPSSASELSYLVPEPPVVLLLLAAAIAAGVLRRSWPR